MWYHSSVGIMLNEERIRDIFQNKNIVMFVASALFMCGILACFYGYSVILAILLTVSMIILLYLRLLDIRKVIIFVLIFYSGFFLTFCKIKNFDDLLYKVPVDGILSGRIVSIPEKIDNSKVRFFMHVDGVNSDVVDAKTFVTISNVEEKSIDKYNIGEKVSVSGRLRKPFTSTNPSQFDYSSYLRNFNTFTTFYADNENVSFILDKKSFKWKFLQFLNNARYKILGVHAKYLKSPNLEILGGIVFGDDAVSPPDYVKNSFVNSGLLHILAASGMNVAFIFSFWFVILNFFKVPYKPRVISGMLVVILYTFMTGLGPSVIRAALMLLFVMAGKLIDRDTYEVSLLSLVAVLMLIYNPAYINDVSFQLSFWVTFGLLTMANVIVQKLEKIPNWIKIPILIPIVAQLWVAPIQMFYFNTFSLYSVFANITTVSLLSVISFCGFVSSILALVPYVGDFICMIFDFILNYLLTALVYISNFFAGLKYSLVQTTHPDIYQIFLYYVMLGLITVCIHYDKYRKAMCAFICISLVLLCTTIKPVSKDLEVIAFDVGNADSFLIKTPANKYFMIDTGKVSYGSGNSQAKIIMLKYLKDRGIKNLEGVIVTHYDSDHAGGTSDVISNTKTKTLYLNSKDVETQTGHKIFETIKTTKQNFKIVENNTEIYSENDLRIKVYKASVDGVNASNDSSIITLLSYKNFDMIFMGDAGVESFNLVKKDIPQNVEVLKVGHHGASRVVDSGMLDYLANKISLISTGTNYFGHPNKGTLDILRNTEILRTDLMHSIKISTNGNNYKTYSYDLRDKKYKILSEYFSK